MRLLVLFRGNWTITAAVDPDGKCPVKEGLKALEGRTAADRSVFTRRIERLSESGMFHNWEHGHPLEDGISELKGKYIRVLYFKDEDRLVVCTRMALKGKAKVLEQEISGAKATRERYLAAKAVGGVSVEEEEEEG